MIRIPISSVYSHGNADPPEGKEADRRNWAARAKAWHDHGIAVIHPRDVLDEWTRKAIENEADRLYGQRKGAGNGRER